ncbi:DUF6916 family protein [Diaphorobacter caeni]|uniref:DUF6916 family protein n=1 Tax=Diaphorobacter caeni TaxID=2784387 RepID=UPI00188E9C88|nr:hypothetical protein [Diaphorobacter caeni]MBF5004223.1 hypothetical protein [Diaphorobacter caeni]
MTDAADTHLLDDAVWARSLTHDIANQLQGQSMQCFYGDAQGHSHVAPLLLRAVKERPSLEQFQQLSLYFQGPASPQLPQQTYRMRHAELGDFAVFITPIARNAEGVEYEACVSHAG